MKTVQFVLLFIGLFASQLPAADGKPPFKNVGVEEFDKLRSEKNTVVLDVRTETEFKSGHIPGAINLDFQSSDFQKRIAALDKGRTYLVHCAGGVRSAKACAAMDKIAFTNLVNLEPGFRAWEKAGKPVAR